MSQIDPETSGDDSPHPDSSDDAHDAADDATDDAELDGLRIRQIATLRSSAYRSRSHAVIAMLVCVGATIESLAYLLRDLIHFGLSWRPIPLAAIAILGIVGTRFFMQRAIALHREATTPHKAEPTSTPDFSTLQDGSQRWRNLDQMR